ncbi:hypothetical protein Tco_1234891 [Tanacetum coccineum]
MLRRLRFKFATKILLHEINVHAQKMLDLAKEFDKLESDEKMSIIVNALKNRKELGRWLVAIADGDSVIISSGGVILDHASDDGGGGVSRSGSGG